MGLPQDAHGSTRPLATCSSPHTELPDEFLQETAQEGYLRVLTEATETRHTGRHAKRDEKNGRERKGQVLDPDRGRELIQHQQISPNTVVSE